MSIRKACLSLSLGSILWLSPATALAQGKGDVEVFFGITHVRLDYAGELAASGEDRLDLWGVHADLTFYFSDHLGVTLDASFPRRGIDVVVPTEVGDLAATVEFSQATYLAGPRYRFTVGKKFTPSVQAMIGFTNGSVGTVTIEQLEVPIYLGLDESGFAAAADLNLDFSLGETFTLRLLQAGILYTGYGDGSQTSPRFAIGIVGRF